MEHLVRTFNSQEVHDFQTLFVPENMYGSQQHTYVIREFH